MKLSNIWIAYKSTILGFAITTLTFIGQAVTAGPINWKILGTAILANLILCITDILKEIKVSDK